MFILQLTLFCLTEPSAVLVITVCDHPKGGTFTTKLDLKNVASINHKTVFGIRNKSDEDSNYLKMFDL